ncbi:MAG: TonB-dependent receptor [Steroidobacteraceae bacterium]
MATGAAGAVGHSNDALAQTATESTTTEEVVVTGSLISRAIDSETSSPIQTISQATIAASGVQTTGDLIQQLPSVAGSAMNTGVNNGGGFGESNVELRGLDARRTLVLLNGRRISLIGASGAVDLNQIPLSIIDHVDVLKEGAGAIYGSDAIAGVVNIVTRKGFSGIEVGGQYGQTTAGDGKTRSVNVLMGGSTDKLDIMVSGNYTKIDEVSTAARNFSAYAQYLYSGSTGRIAYASGGSSRVPNGRIYLTGSPVAGTGTGQIDCSSVTRKAGTTGSTLDDYRCYGSSDGYNYQSNNLLQTPQERGALFTTANYALSDDLTAYADVLYNKTHSGYEIAPLPFDATADNIVIPADATGNIFGIAFGGSDGTNNDLRTRFLTLGNRTAATDSASSISNFGLKGSIPDTSWQWDATLGYNRLDQMADYSGYVNYTKLQEAIDDGTINMFDLDDAATIAALKSISSDIRNYSTYVTKSGAVNLNGELFALPAGTVRAAVGAEVRSLSYEFQADSLVQATADTDYLECEVAQEACTGNSAGSYNDHEFFGEIFVPVLKDLPGAQTLNLDLGVRSSAYSGFSASTKSQFKVEYKPVANLMLRGTFSQVFRVPTLNDLYGAPGITSATYSSDSYCASYTGTNANITAACSGATSTGLSQITGLITSNPDLKPETGYVDTFGFVLQVPGVENLSVSVDDWHYKLTNLITTLDPNYTVQQCVKTGAAAYCDLIHRYSGSSSNAGNIYYIEMTTVNLGQLRTDGADVEVKYGLPHTPVGAFQFALNATYTNSYAITPYEGAPTTEYAGTYNTQFGNYARWRGTVSSMWKLGNYDAMFDLRYIHHIVVHNPAGGEVTEEADLKVPPIIYADMTLGYTIEKTRTKLQLGMQNITNRQPPILYMNNVTNSNTDVSTYDLLGRRFFLSFKQSL